MLTLESGVLFDNARRLIQGEVDFAIGHLPSVDNQDIESLKLCDIKLLPVMQKSLFEKQKISKALLQSIPNIVVKTNEQGGSQIAQNADLKWYVDSHTRKTELILAGIGWGRLSESQLKGPSKDKKSLKVIPEELVPTLEFEIHLMRNRKVPHGPIAKSIWADFH